MEMPAWVQNALNIGRVVAEYVGIVAGAGGGLAAFGRYIVWPFVRHYRATMQGFAQIAKFNERLTNQEANYARRNDELDRKLNRILAELRPNGGTSLRDAVDRMSVEVAGIRGVQRKLVNDSLTPSFQCDPIGDCIFANEAYMAIVGRERTEVMGTNWLNCIEPEDRDRVQRAWEDCIYNRRRFELRYRYVQPNGKTTSAFCRAEPIFGDKQQVVMWIGTLYPDQPAVAQ
jgi:PAS domain S-box-containing protein